MSEVLVGYDGSPASEQALRWAVRESSLRGLPLAVCHAWHWPYAMDPVHLPSVETVRRFAENLLYKGVFEAEGLAPRVKVRSVLHRGPAASALLHEAGRAAMVVLGARGGEGFPELPTGSTATQVAGHASCPVVIVREPGADGPVAVGVDGSHAADAALAFAFEEAALRDRELVAVHAAPPPSDPARHEEAAREAGVLLQRQVAPWATKYPQVRMRTRLLHEEPREALRAAAEEAALLVLGDRRDDTPATLRLGAVSSALLDLTPRTLVVVHPWRRS
ncbi:universal stress protein [Actinocorallia populi]|uniref:universal stress protein n=1 Tax=Actinocorallia populi TaxID=2079200 RepID=UPI000D095D2B|nr:universal stress protein [Actinocorallia populi]